MFSFSNCWNSCCICRVSSIALISVMLQSIKLQRYVYLTMEITLIRQNTIIYQIFDKTYEFERSLPVTIAFMTGTVQTTVCRHISVDDLSVSDLIVQLYAFFPRFCSSYFPLSQTKVSHFMQCSAKIRYIFLLLCILF
jgi:hypothetical protein